MWLIKRYRRNVVWQVLAAMLLGPGLASGCELTMGWEPWEPYQYETRDGELTGLDIEIIRAVAGQMGCRIVFRELPWKRHLRELAKGDIDIAAGADFTRDRQDYAHYSRSYRTEKVQLFVQAGKADTYQLSGLEDIAREEFTLGISLGHHYGPGFDRIRSDPSLGQYIEDVREDMLNFRKLARGRVDGILADPAVLYAKTSGTELEGKFEPYPLHVKVQPVHVIFSRQSTDRDLVARFNEALDSITDNGMYDRILNSYLPSSDGR